MDRRESILPNFNVDVNVSQDVLAEIYGHDIDSAVQNPLRCLEAWFAVLPDNIQELVVNAEAQMWPFLPNDVSHNWIFQKHSKFTDISHIEILLRCLDMAIQAKEFEKAAALAFVIDRFMYRYGGSSVLLNIVDKISQLAPNVVIAPQVIIRKARVMKDNGNLHGAMKVLDQMIDRAESKWDYKNENQYLNVATVCIQIKGHIYHNLGLWKEAIGPLVQTVHGFNQLKDDKGTSSSLSLLSRCLSKLNNEEYQQLKGVYSFMYNSPFYEAYYCGMVALYYAPIDNLFMAKHQLVADENLLMYTVNLGSQQENLLHTVLHDLKISLRAHKSIDILQASEQFYEFIRAVFVASLILHLSPYAMDGKLSSYFEDVSLFLYQEYCRRHLAGEHRGRTVKAMNSALTLLGIESLAGSELVEERTSGQPSEKSTTEEGPSDEEANKIEPDESHDTDLKSKDTSSWVDGIKVEKMVRHLAGTVPVRRSVQVDKSRQDKAITVAGDSVDTIWKELSHHGCKYGRKFVGLPADPEEYLAKFDLRQIRNIESMDASVEIQPVVNVNATILSTTESRNIQSSATKLTSLSSDLASTISSPAEDSSLASTEPSPSGSDSQLNSSNSSSALGDLFLPMNKFYSNSVAILNFVDSAGHYIPVSRQTNTGIIAHPAIIKEQTPVVRKISSSRESGDISSVSSSTDVSSTKSSILDLPDSAEELCQTFESLGIGSGTSSTDPAEFLSRWQPSAKRTKDGYTVQRSNLWTYNPENGQWNGQSTLAMIGPEIPVEKKGNCRKVYEVKFLHQDEPLGKYVGKRYILERSPQQYLQDTICQMLARYYVTSFNQKLQTLQGNQSTFQVYYLPVYHLQMLSETGNLEYCVNVEPFLKGKFEKITNNLNHRNDTMTMVKGDELRDISTAISHYSYCMTQGHLMLVDIQGFMPLDGTGIVYLTDPQFHTVSSSTVSLDKFCTADHGKNGMDSFWMNVHPSCNKFCGLLSLKRPESQDR